MSCQPVTRARFSTVAHHCDKHTAPLVLIIGTTGWMVVVIGLSILSPESVFSPGR
ncbi:uncharacterized protein BO72DRAFT_450483 [Aspergillus fijiensis CBS 313.89]|uniref:Uncharacterized protein n=1 Tax=Aspergillus fijiensis CBS 313.89 TaxID=1448319 RepID=A0A8G1RL76_9EURO|nr:uncharacterized protein BO72DRAFT_450483 [Aspergillus fijiensis CBS 313.89]RAK74804.1 hypothetical protein BO72DRAFT_450483 [Aspergillus fijiensis CBS 313.89]